ncbi:MAG TPA: hypothetical protein VFC63_05165 [Blastocatellia bacterium]|nr:hypothetical protein [Blastocatellia bacterium]
MHRILLILFGLSLFAGAAVAQNYRPEPVSVSKNVLRAYDRFHDRTTVMLKAFPVAASVGKQHYLLSMTTGFAFDGKVPSKRPDSILVYFRETSWTAISATDSLEDPRPRAKGENLYLNRQSEVIALADGERIKLPHGDETLDFNGGDESGQATIIVIPLALYRRIAAAKKLEILVGDVVVEPYMKKTRDRLIEMAAYAESIQGGK